MSEDDREKWYRDHCFPWANDAQWDCILLLEQLNCGFHHMNTKRVKEWGDGVTYTTDQHFATFDFDNLTRFVKLCHDRCIRGEIGTAGMKLRLSLHKRQREGRMYERHPSWEDIK